MSVEVEQPVSLIEESSPPGPAPRQRRRLERVLVIALSLIALAASIAAGWVWNRPLGPELMTQPPGDAAGQQAAIPDAPESSAEGAAQAQCGGPPVMFVMLVGNDSPRNDYNQGFADVIRLARIDFVQPSATLLAVPRDLWVVIPAAGDEDETANRIKTAYAYGNARLGTGGGPSLLAQALTLNFGAAVDHYVILNFAAFEEGIDAIGGVEIELTKPFDGSEVGLPFYEPGTYQFDGQTALLYARARPDNGSDLNRIERQTALIQAIQARVFSPQVLPSVPRMMRLMQDSFLTDLSPHEISALLCLGQRMSSEDIQTVTIPPDLYTVEDYEDGFQVLLPHTQDLITYFARFQAGESISAP
jgi:LCP family protein required for cell wall assembly